MKALRIILVLIYVVLIALLLILKGCQKEEPKPQKAMIQVVDADSREPIEGARVKVKTTDESCPSVSLTTDEDGECSFDYTDPEAQMEARATKRGYEPVEVEDVELSYFEDETLVIPLHRKNVVEEGREIGATGKLKVTLLWDDETVDLDLHVTQPNRFEIYYEDGHRSDRRTGGALDVDWIPTEGDPEHIGENIFWANPPRGRYKVEVELYNPEEAQPTPCTVIVYREGAEPQTFPVTLQGYKDRQHITDVAVE